MSRFSVPQDATLEERERLSAATVEYNRGYATTCLHCGTELWLWWNDGELDQVVCCGTIYRLEHRELALVVGVPAGDAATEAE